MNKLNKKMILTYSSSLNRVVEKNSSFDGGILQIAYTGKNRNNTFISKKAFEKAIPTMFNVPIVAHYMEETDKIGAHDIKEVKTSSGESKFIYVTEPVGVVPESAQWYWEDIEDNGEIHQYLCTDVLLWKRQQAYDKIKKNGVTKQSMEIEVQKGEMKDDYYDIKDFTFTAFCLLGTAEPCFESASLLSFTKQQQETFETQYTEMLKDFKTAFADVSTTHKAEIKEVEVDLNKFKELLEKYSLEESDIKFDIEGLSDEELEKKFKEEFEQKPEAEPEINPEPKKEPDSFELNTQLSNILYDIVRNEKIEDEWGSYSRRYMVDYDVEKKEVYYRDLLDGKLYGCTFEQDGDDIVCDFETQKRKKYAIIDFVEGSNSENFTLDFESIRRQFSEAYNSLKTDLEKAQTDKAEFDRLAAFEKDILEKERKEKETELFTQFDELLSDNSEYKTLKENSSNYELKELEKQMYYLLGQTVVSQKNTQTKNEKNEPVQKENFSIGVSSLNVLKSNDLNKNEDEMRSLFRNAGIPDPDTK